MDRRELLESALEESEEGTLIAPEEVEINEEPVAEIEEPEIVEQEVKEEQFEEPIQIEAVKTTRPTTWKKEYLPIWDKLEKGEQVTQEEFTKFAEYANKREDDYKKGVSTYRQEAEHAKVLRQAIEPYMGELQRRNIQPAQYINALANADMMLTHAPYEQKVAMFQKLAQDYGINFNNESIAPIQQDQYTQQLMQQLQYMNQEVGTIKQRYEQEESSRLQSEIQRVAQNVDKFPHFEEVRLDMAQLLERGLASDLETAYAKAVRMNDEVFAKEQDRLLNSAQQNRTKQQQVAKARAKSVSPRSVTPNSLVANLDKKDRKSMLDQQLSELGNRI